MLGKHPVKLVRIERGCRRRLLDCRDLSCERVRDLFLLGKSFDEYVRGATAFEGAQEILDFALELCEVGPQGRKTVWSRGEALPDDLCLSLAKIGSLQTMRRTWMTMRVVTDSTGGLAIGRSGASGFAGWGEARRHA
jgi:hypothetical protein